MRHSIFLMNRKYTVKSVKYTNFQNLLFLMYTINVVYLQPKIIQIWKSS